MKGVWFGFMAILLLSSVEGTTPILAGQRVLEPDFGWSIEMGFLPTAPDDTVTFTDMTRAENVSGPLMYLWDFGDGVLSEERNPTHSYSYSTIAAYKVTLTVCDSDGCESISHNISLVRFQGIALLAILIILVLAVLMVRNRRYRRRRR